jgi:HUS1 checkpoint protein
MLPPLTKMRAVVERMRSLSDVIAVRANSSGCLQLSASTEAVKADITWNNCSHPRMSKIIFYPFSARFSPLRPFFFFFDVAGDSASQTNANADQDENEERERPDPKQLFSVLVHTRSFLKFLNAHTVSKTTIACKAPLPSLSPLLNRSLTRCMPRSLSDSIRIYWGLCRCRRRPHVLHTFRI